MVGDTVFLVGVGAFVWFLFGLLRGHSFARAEAEVSGEEEEVLPAPAE
jgi:hypothetical protein